MGELLIWPKGSWDYCDKCNKATPLDEMVGHRLPAPEGALYGELVMLLCAHCQ